MKPFIQSPHAATVTKDSDVTMTEWPVVTASLLESHQKMIATYKPPELNQPIFALMRARKALHDALLSVQFARRLYDKGTPVAERLDSMITALKSEHVNFPLTMLENAQNRPRRHIMAGHDSVDRPVPWGVE